LRNHHAQWFHLEDAGIGAVQDPGQVIEKEFALHDAPQIIPDALALLLVHGLSKSEIRNKFESAFEVGVPRLCQPWGGRARLTQPWHTNHSLCHHEKRSRSKILNSKLLGFWFWNFVSRNR